MRTAVYPGSFDPITNGHLDILKRALTVFDHIIILVAVNNEKNARFPVKTRIEMIKEATAGFGDKVSVDSYDGLTVNYAREHDVKHLIRGLRAVTDFEYEFMLSSANHYADANIEMMFFMAHGDTSFISSSAIIELHSKGVDVSNLVPTSVLKRL